MATTHSSLNAVECLSRWLDHAGGELTADAARFFLALKIPAEDRQRISELNRRNAAGQLSRSEEAEFRDVLHLVQLIEMLQLRSRVVLQPSS